MCMSETKSARQALNDRTRALFVSAFLLSQTGDALFVEALIALVTQTTKVSQQLSSLSIRLRYLI